LEIAEGQVQRFVEKPPGDNALINGGFFVLNPSVIDRLDGDATIWEREPLEGLAADGQLMAFRHTGFWAAMDTLRDKNILEGLWASGEAPWRR
jgi:glucose-1-phosphate cytidylyltransferase